MPVHDVDVDQVGAARSTGHRVPSAAKSADRIEGARRTLTGSPRGNRLAGRDLETGRRILANNPRGDAG
jgi:hypothetical protein